MIRLIAAIMVATVLAACSTTNPTPPPIVQTQVFVPSLPSSVFYCNDEVSYPDPDTLTEKQVGDLFALLDERLKECGANADFGRTTWYRLKANAEAANTTIAD